MPDIPASTAAHTDTGADTRTHDAGLSLPERVRRQQMLALFHNRVGVNLVAFAISLLFWLACWVRLRNPWIPVWGVALHLTQLLPIPWYRSFVRASAREQIAPHWVTQLNGILAVSALLWGAAPWLLMPPDDLLLTAVVVIMMLGIVSGSIASLASFRGVLCSPSRCRWRSACAWRCCAGPMRCTPFWPWRCWPTWPAPCALRCASTR